GILASFLVKVVERLRIRFFPLVNHRQTLPWSYRPPPSPAVSARFFCRPWCANAVGNPRTPTLD
ncbi:MAG: hypothetical protein AB8B50_02770, partial [Pirellulaceae bacterium]